MRALPPLPLGVQLLVITPGALAVAAGLMWHLPPFKWFADVQLATIGSYSMMLTSLLTLLVVSAPLALVARAFVGNRTAGREFRVVDWSRRHPWAFRGGIMGLTFLGIGGYNLANSATAGELEFVSAAALERGEDPGSRFLNVDGVRALDAAVTWEEDRKETTYVPIGSIVAPAEGYAVVAAFDAYENVEIDALQGMLRPIGMPGDVRASMEEMGVRFAGDVVLLEVGEEPGQMHTFHMVISVIGLALLLASVVGSQLRRVQPV